MRSILSSSLLLLINYAYELTPPTWAGATGSDAVYSQKIHIEASAPVGVNARLLLRSEAFQPSESYGKDEASNDDTHLNLNEDDDEKNKSDNFTDIKQMRFCPEGCSKYTSDGCNSCVCDQSGMIKSCTRRFCALPGPSQCLQTITDGHPTDGHPNTDDQTSSTTTSTTMPASTSSVGNKRSTTALSHPLRQCPKNCRIFKPDACNECLCNPQGVTKWCSQMVCDSDANTSAICIEFLDGQRTDNDSEQDDSSSTERVLITTQGADQETLSTEEEEPSPEPPVPDLKKFPDLGGPSGGPTANCGPPDQLLDQCPPMCSLALINCHICSCDTGSTIEWCTPCIERCSMRRIACLDVSVSGTGASLQKDQIISTNISELKVHIHITNNTITHAPGSIQCDEHCNVSTLNVSATEWPYIGIGEEELIYPIPAPSLEETEASEFTTTPPESPSAQDRQQIEDNQLPEAQGSSNRNPGPLVPGNSRGQRSKGSSHYSAAVDDGRTSLQCSRLLQVRHNNDSSGPALSMTLNMSEVELCPLISMGCFFCECDTQKDKLKRCGVWDRWNMKKCFPLLMDSVHDGNLRSVFNEHELSGSLHLPQCVSDLEISADLEAINSILNNNKIDGQSLLSWTILHSIPSFHQIWEMLTKGVHWPASLKITNPFPLGSLPFPHHKHDSAQETDANANQPTSIWAQLLQTTMRFFFSLDADELNF